MRTALALALAVLLLAPHAAAHSGSLAPGDSLARATPIRAPARIFETTAEGVDLHYYRIDSPGELTIRLAAPAGHEPKAIPIVFLFGPEFETNASAPPDVEAPALGGVTFAASESAEASLAALGLRVTVLLDRSLTLAEGTHILVVRSQSAGPLLLMLDAPGAQWAELFLTPGLRDEARAWAGIPAWPALAAGAVGVALVAGIAWISRARPWSLHSLAAFGCAALVAGTGGALATDAARTGAGWVLVGGAALSAAYAIVSTRPPLARPAWWQRVLLAAAGLLAFFLYAGALWGPIAALAGALLPEPSER